MSDKTTNPKYEIIDIPHPDYPHLHRIRALRDVGENVHAGDWGGYVQTADNLSQEGDCWIFGDAIACEDALVSQGAQVSEEAVIRGSALVSGTASVSGSAVVEDHAIVMAGTVEGDCFISGNARLCENRQTHFSPLITDRSIVFGEIFGSVAVYGSSVILPGAKIDMPTKDILEIMDGKARLHRVANKWPIVSKETAKKQKERPGR